MKKLLQMVTLIFALALISPNTFGQNQALSINPSGQVVNPVANIYFPLGATGQFSGTFTGDGGGLTNLFAGTFVNVLQAGCTNDGVTDNTVALNKLARLGNVLLFPPGNYIVTNTVYPTNGTVFYGYGATLTFNGTNVGPLINTAHTANWAILGLTLDGLGYGTNLGYYAFITNTGPSTTMASFTNAENNNPLGRWNGASQRHGIFCNNNFGTIHDVIIRGFNGAALYPYNTNGQSAHATARTVVNGLTCYSNFIGICASPVGTVSGSSAVPWFTNWVNVPTAWTTSGNGCDAQYMVFQNCNCFCNEVGASIGGANNIFIGCNFDNNYHQLLAGGDGSVSGITGHGRVANCSVNHGYSTPIILVNPLGYSIDNCSIRANGGSGIQIYGNSAYDISIKNCDFDAPPVLTENFLGGGNYNIFANNKYAGAWNANLIANLDGHLRIYGNVSTTVAGDTDGSGLALVGYNNGSGLTNLQAGSLTGTLPTNSIPAGAILTGTTNNDASLLGTENVGAAGWSYDASWSGSYSAGWQHQTNSATGLIWTNNLSSGKYQVTWTVTNRTNGTFSLVWFGQSAGAVLSASGAYGPTIPGGSTNLFITPTTNFDGTIAVSVKKITAGSQPMLTLFDSTSNDRFELRENNVFGNTFVGLNAGLYSTTGSQNTANGQNALYSNTTGSQNTANGQNALYSNTTGSYNTANGQNALYSNTTGSYNTANGQYALYSNTTGSQNTANGQSALYYNTTGSYNTANGQNASYYNTTGSYNTANGQYALVYNTTGSYNTVNGQNALRYLSDGSTSATNLNNTIALGDNVRALTNGESYSITIGSGAQSLGSSNTVIGTIQTSRTTIFGVVCATNGYSSSPITGNTSDLFAGYSTNGTKIFQVDSNGVVNGNGSGLTNLQPSNLTGNQGRVVTTSGPSLNLTTGVNYFPLGYWNQSAGVGAGAIAGFAGSCSNFCLSEQALGTTNVSVYIGTNYSTSSETYIGTIFPTTAGYNYTNWQTTFYNTSPTNQIFLVLSNWSATTTVSARFQLTFTY